MSNPRLVVVVTVPHYWGKGETLAAAWQRVRKESCSTLRELKRNPYRVQVVPETDEFEAYVDSMGTLHWANVDDLPALVIDRRD